MKRSYDRDLLQNVSTLYPELLPPEFVDYWLDQPHNYMYAKEQSVGLFTYEYPGAYTGHWFFTDNHRGRAAIKLADKMIGTLFEETDAQIIRGLVKEGNRPSRWLARQVGLTSHGLMEFPKGNCELFTLTKEEYMNKKEKLNG